MRSYPILLSVAAIAVLAGCSSHTDAPAASSATTASSISEPPPLPQEAPLHAGAVAVSPGGVTTAVDVPSDATESQYGQACHAAKLWLDEQHAQPVTLVEDYLKTLQAPEANGPGSFNTPWAQLTPAQQAGVIMAANAAANGECG
ncbi:MAG: lipoprotein LpqV [Mycolicibacterium cosmeticum]|nr:lipoprotein LpqV [Mycolicibacterium cosmeticum]